MRASLALASLATLASLPLGCGPPASPCARDRDCATAVCVEGRCLDGPIGDATDAAPVGRVPRARISDLAAAAHEMLAPRPLAPDELPPAEPPPMPAPLNAEDAAAELLPSCLDYLIDNAEAPSGAYRIEHLFTGEPVVVWCDMDTEGGGWTVLADVRQLGCPEGWEHVAGRGCGRPNANVQQIASAFFGVPVEYTAVRGSARARSSGGANKAFDVLFDDIDASTPYVDGLSLTVNATGARTHLYTFAAGAADGSAAACPALGGAQQPAEVDEHFSCDTAGSFLELWSGDDPGDDRADFSRIAPSVYADQIEARIMSPFLGLQTPVYVTSLSVSVR